LRSWGVTPVAVVGHSSGEIAAAYTTGSLTCKEAMLAAYFRGLATRTKLADGAMAAVGLGTYEVRQYLAKGVVIGCQNSPNSTTISGDRAAVANTIATMQRELPHVFVRPLHVDNAYHSRECCFNLSLHEADLLDHMQAYGADYEESINGIRSSNDPSIPFFSTVTGKIINSRNNFTASYWRRNLENPVLFHTAIRNIIKADLQNPIFLEIGPHSALAGPLRQIFQAEDVPLTYISSLQRGKDDTECIYNSIGNLWSNNVVIDFNALNPIGSVLTDLPCYSWNHSVKYWDESRPSKEWRERKFLPHDILGIRLAGTSQLEPTWRKILRLDEVGWIRDHQVGTDIVFPVGTFLLLIHDPSGANMIKGAGYVCMAGEAIRQLTGRSDYSVRGLSIRTAMIVDESKPNDVTTTFKKAKLTINTDSEWWEFRITSFNGSTWSEHCFGQAKAGPIHSTIRSVSQPDFLRKISASRWYATMRKVGFHYGPAFQGLREISADPAGNEAAAIIDNNFEKSDSFYELHPCTLDKLFQLMTIAQHEGIPSLSAQLSMPTYIDEIYISGGMKELRATATSYKNFMGAWSSDEIATADGQIVFEMKGLRVTGLGNSRNNEDKPKNAVQLVWGPDIDFLDVNDLIRPTVDYRGYLIALEKYFFLLARETVKTIASIDTQESHLIKFRLWLNDFVEATSRGENQLLPDGKHLAVLSKQNRLSLIQSMANEFEASPAKWVATVIRRVHENAQARYRGSVDTLELLMEGGALTQVCFYGMVATITTLIF
jgi:acyl transferase family protein/polyketide synthase-like dehydratase family protein/polyketide synthase family protein